MRGEERAREESAPPAAERSVEERARELAESSVLSYQQALAKLSENDARAIEEETGPQLDFQEPLHNRAYLRAVGRYARRRPLPAIERERARIPLAYGLSARELFEQRQAELAEEAALADQAEHEEQLEEEAS